MKAKLYVPLAFLVAAPIEALNFYRFTPPLDVGLSTNASWYVKLLAAEWICIHLPGLLALDWVERIQGCRQLELVMVMACRRVDNFVFFASGYITTALFLILVAFGVHKLCRSVLNRNESRRSIETP